MRDGKRDDLGASSNFYRDKYRSEVGQRKDLRRRTKLNDSGKETRAIRPRSLSFIKTIQAGPYTQLNFATVGSRYISREYRLGRPTFSRIRLKSNLRRRALHAKLDSRQRAKPSSSAATCARRVFLSFP